jgi:hypothetical protein
MTGSSVGQSGQWLDPVVEAAEAAVGTTPALRYTPAPLALPAPGQTLVFHLPFPVSAASLGFAGQTYPLTVSGTTASWTAPAGVSGLVGPALLGTTTSRGPGESYALVLWILSPGGPLPSLPAPVPPTCAPPPSKVCAAYGAKISLLTGKIANARLVAGRARTARARSRALLVASRLTRKRAAQSAARIALCTKA